jgi:hypothetical protein
VRNCVPSIHLVFDWNEPKRLANLETHRVDFKDAALIFEGQFSNTKTNPATIASPAFPPSGVSAMIISWSSSPGAVRPVASSAHGEWTVKASADTKQYSAETLKAERMAGETRTRPDAPTYPVDDAFWRDASAVMPAPNKASVHLRLDPRYPI